MIPLFQDVVIWLLKHDLLITLHLRIRVVVTPELKVRVRELRAIAIAARREKLHAVREENVRVSNGGGGGRGVPGIPEEAEGDRDGGRGNNGSSANTDDVDVTKDASTPADSSPVNYWLTMSPKSARRHTRKLSTSHKSEQSRSSLDENEERMGRRGGAGDHRYAEYYDDDEDEEEDDEDGESIISDDSGSPEWDRSSIICDPARATRLERAWLDAMSEGKEPHITKRFEQYVPLLSSSIFMRVEVLR